MVARRADVDVHLGLTGEEAARRLVQDGRNELAPARAVPRWRRVVEQFHDPLIYLLLAAVLVSLVAWLVEGSSGVPVDALVITVIVVANAVIGYLQEAHAQNAVAALRSMTEVSSVVVRDGSATTVPSPHLVVGDLLVLGEGDSVGADARLVHTAALHLAESALTGESEAVTKDPATLVSEVPLGDRTDMVYKGTAVTRGRGRAVVTATGMDTEVGSVARLLDTAVEGPTPLQTEIAFVGKVLGIAVVVIAAVVMTTVWWVNGVDNFTDAMTVLLLGVSLAVAAVPEGLPAILSVVLSIGVQRMARRDAIVKKLSSVEALGAASVICSDKTGTLTRNEMTIERLVTATGTVEISGVGYAPTGCATSAGHAVDDPDLYAEMTAVLSGGSLASDAQLQQVDGSWQITGDPTEAAFLVAETKVGLTEGRTRRFTRVEEVPFTSERKMMSVVCLDHEYDDAPVLVTKGAPESLLSRCTHLRSGTQVVPLTDAHRLRIGAEVEELSAKALRTLSVAYRPLTADEVDRDDRVPEADLEHDLVLAGTVGMLDPPREEAGVAVEAARRAGIRVVMITGDHPATALRIAQDLGIADPATVAVTGQQLQQMGDDALRLVVQESCVYARVAPEHKLRIVSALQSGGNVVAMTGDGVNDAPALKSADIGVAMGISGTSVTQEAAAMILADDDFSTILVAVRQGRVIFDNIKKFLRYLLSSNMGEVLSVFGGVVLAGVLGLKGASTESVVLPLLATQILWVNLVTDSAPALAMGVEPETDDVMARRPRSRNDRVIDARMWAGVLVVGLVIAVATLFTIDIFLPGGTVDGSDSLDVARTAGFTTLVLAQLFNAFNSRSETTSAFQRVFVNGWLWAAVAAALAAQVLVVEVPFLQQAFGTASLDPLHWVICLALASSVLWADELRKVVLRHRDSRHLNHPQPVVEGPSPRDLRL
ncbi:MAG: cation-translocating P-type ATPase [Marmoricola sp.]